MLHVRQRGPANAVVPLPWSCKCCCSPPAIVCVVVLQMLLFPLWSAKTYFKKIVCRTRREGILFLRTTLDSSQPEAVPRRRESSSPPNYRTRVIIRNHDYLLPHDVGPQKDILLFHFLAERCSAGRESSSVVGNTVFFFPRRRRTGGGCCQRSCQSD